MLENCTWILGQADENHDLECLMPECKAKVLPVQEKYSFVMWPGEKGTC